MKKLFCMMIALALMLTVVGVAEEPSVITVASGSQFTTLDPALNTEVVNNYVINHIYVGLFTTDENNVAQKELCKDYTVSEDGLTYTFTLNDNFVWSDGTPITSNDVVYSWLRALSYGPDNVWAINDMMSYIVGAMDYNAKALEAGTAFDCTVEDYSYVGITAPDDFTVVLTLTMPCAYLTNLLASNAWTPVCAAFAPQHESLWAYEGGYPTSGAYTLLECNENEKAVMVKNPLYYDAANVMNDQIEILVMPDDSAQLMAYQTGEIDVATSISSETAIQYKGQDDLWIMPRCSNYTLAINSGSTGPEWAKNANVRKALNMAIDKDALVDLLGGADLYPTLLGYVPTGVSGVTGDFRAEGDAEGKKVTYDLEGAKALLAQEGYDESNPLVIKYKYSNNGMHADVATTLEYMWGQAGVVVEPVSVESGVFYDQLDQGDFEIARYGYVASDDAMQYLELWTTQIQVVAAVDDPLYDQMCADARKLVDKTEYYTKLHEIEDYLDVEMTYAIPLFNYTTPMLVNPAVTGCTQHGGSIWLADIVK